MTDQREPAEQTAATASGGMEIKKLGYSLYLRIPDNRMECRCSYVPRDQQGSMLTRDDLNAYLKQYSVKEGLDQAALDNFVVKAAAGQQIVDELLAAGTPPVAGADEFISISIKPSVLIHKGDDADDESSVDMHIVQTFLNVSAGEEIGRIIPPGAGTPGRNISGQIVPPAPGKPLICKIGKNIILEEGGALLIAAASGRLCQAAGEISVEEEYVVKGDVNFRIGSINFKGVVEVRGDVLDNFNITASKGLTVTGNIGVCNIASDGDITFCGMDGQDKAHIVCGGTLHANFIHDVIVDCAGDVIVGVEIHNCIIRTHGRIIVEKGAIAGGSYIAKGGIEARKLGSPSSLHTRLVAGVDYNDIIELEQLFEALAKNQADMAQAQSPSEIEEMRKARAQLSERIMAIRGKTDDSANAKINVKAVLYENVQLTLGSVTETIKEQLDGAHSVIENSIEGGLRFLSMTGLGVKAADIEHAFALEHKRSLQHLRVP